MLLHFAVQDSSQMAQNEDVNKMPDTQQKVSGNFKKLVITTIAQARMQTPYNSLPLTPTGAFLIITSASCDLFIFGRFGILKCLLYRLSVLTGI